MDIKGFSSSRYTEETLEENDTGQNPDTNKEIFNYCFQFSVKWSIIRAATLFWHNILLINDDKSIRLSGTAGRKRDQIYACKF